MLRFKQLFTDYCRRLFSASTGDSSDSPGPLIKDRYKNLQFRLFILIGTLACVPLVLVSILSFFWIQGTMKEDFNNQLRGNIDNTRQSIEFFIDERISALRFIAAADSFGQLTDDKKLNDMFMKFKREFGEVVDLGVIDSSGVQLTYSGPYDLAGRNYSNQDWFNEVVVRGVYVSDVFMGYRKIPHFAIAVKKDVPEKGTFWILRATIDMATLNRYVSTLNLKSKDEAFIINRYGILQTPSRYHGNVLEKINIDVPHSNEIVSLTEVPQRSGSPLIFGSTSIKHSQWIMGVIVASTARSKLLELLTSDIAAIYFAIFLIIVGVIANLRITIMVVNWIRDAELEREEAIAQTQHAGRLASIGRLGAGVAHEINNPLAIINEKAGLMEDILIMSKGSNIDREKFLGLIHAIVDSVNRCKAITQRLLGFARRMDVRHEEIDLNDTIKEVIEFLEKEILYRNIRLETDLKEDLPRVVSDKGQLQQVFLNIINNAIDAVADGGRIVVSTKVRRSGKVRVSIKDNGEGIPKDKIAHIFEPFYTTKEKGKGTGLGLSISYGIIDRLGGSINVESEVGVGTVFHVDLPVLSEAR
jgi:two-component system, NtrC family, sensor kinase